ncbi:hypothetical protein [Saccharibacillus kuerlensis]|uniref:Uncharacterized protein n=1 Tax=Saccharibacillus kuerlensis TaxID=459527 RepID=A0ABQ2L5E1_9BACL|nr:hypothetical protein [Saccharibacillus kuerlensis]GGO01130.1 hypothetical protein GCM10010969_23100 [Saccharibacillus kuerlensis]
MNNLSTTRKSSFSKKFWTALDVILFLTAAALLMYTLSIDMQQPQAALSRIAFGMMMLSCLLRILYRFKSSGKKSEY